MLQTLFTKSSASAKLLSQQEMCARFLRSMDDNRRAARFLMKQFVVDASNQASRSGDIGRAYEKLKEEMTQLKQATNSQRIQSEQTISDLQNRLQALNFTIKEKENQLHEKDNQIAQYREIVMADGLARHPSSSHSNSSGGKRGPSNAVAGSSACYRPQPRSRPSIRPVSSSDSIITPVQATAANAAALYHQRPRSAESNLSFERASGSASRHIRDFTAPRSYSFSNGSGSAPIVMGRSQHHYSKRSRQSEAPSMSPSSAFAYSNSRGGGGGVDGGPFQHRFGHR